MSHKPKAKQAQQKRAAHELYSDEESPVDEVLEKVAQERKCIEVKWVTSWHRVYLEAGTGEEP